MLAFFVSPLIKTLEKIQDTQAVFLISYMLLFEQAGWKEAFHAMHINKAFPLRILLHIPVQSVLT